MSIPRTSRAQAVVLGSFVFQFVVIGCLFSYGVFFPELEAEFGWSRTFLSGCSSLAYLTMGILAIFAGRISDRHGPRVVLTVTGLIYGLAYAALSQISEQWHLFVLLGLLIGIGLSAFDVVTLSTIARWFPQRRGQITGLVKAGTAGGQMLVPLAAGAFIAALGWRDAFLALGLIATALLQLAAWPMRAAPRLPSPDADTSARPAVATLDGSMPSSVADDGVADSSPDFARIRRTRQFRTFCLIQFVIFPVLLTIPVHIVVHGLDLGLSTKAATAVLSTLGGMSIVGRLAIGLTVDRIGGRNGLLVCFGLLLTSLVVLLGAETLPWLLVFAVIFGLAHGGFFTVVSPALAEYFGMKSHGVSFGMVLFFGTLGGPLGPLLAGRSFDLTGSYDPAFVMLIVLGLIGLALTLSLRPIPGR